MNFTLKIMGTASAMPISDRNPSAQVLEVQGRFFLIDCGEGTQQQLRRAHVSFVKIEAIFITHIHGDHLFGLFGLLSSLAMYGKTGKLYIYGPEALGSVLKFYQSFFGEGMNYEIVFTAVKTKELQLVHTSKWVKVSAFPLNHKIECYGYRFDEILTERRKQAIEAGEAPQAKSYAYCSDTAPVEKLSSWVKGVDVLYHEATYQHEMADKAAFRYHSTTVQAAQCARESGVGRLIVAHYSSRITDFEAYINECKEIFPNSVAAHDGDVFEI